MTKTLSSSHYHDLVRCELAASGYDHDAVKFDHTDDSRFDGLSVKEAARKEVARQKRQQRIQQN